MHIAINGWFWDTPDAGSGQYVRELLRALSRIDKENQYSLILPPHITEPEHVPENVNVVHVSGGLHGKIGKVWFEQNQYPQAVKQLNADIAHVPYWGPPMSSPAKLVTSVLDVIPAMFPEYAVGVTNRLYLSLTTAAARGSAQIITLTEAVKPDIAEHIDFPIERIHAIHLAPKESYHPRMGAENDEAVRAKYGLPEDNFVLYMGGFDVRKRVQMLISAYAYLSKAHGYETPLVLAGREPDWRKPLFPNIREYIADHHADDIPEDNVRWIGYVDEVDKPALYRLASLSVYPSAYEGFGLPLLESMASGTPVVANNLAMFDEVVGDGAFLVEDGSAAKMGGAIIAILEQEPLRDTLINAGLARASNFTWRKTARETIEVYKLALDYQD